MSSLTYWETLGLGWLARARRHVSMIRVNSASVSAVERQLVRLEASFVARRLGVHRGGHGFGRHWLGESRPGRCGQGWFGRRLRELRPLRCGLLIRRGGP